MSDQNPKPHQNNPNAILSKKKGNFQSFKIRPKFVAGRGGVDPEVIFDVVK